MHTRPPQASIDAHPIDAETGVVDERKLEVLLVEIQRLARRFARRILRPRDAEDVVQDVVLVCLTSIRKGRWNGRIDPLPSIVSHVVRCRLIDLRRRRDAGSIRDTEFGREALDARRSWMTADGWLEEQESEPFREQALGALTPQCRRAYELVREDGLSYREAGVILGVSRTRVHALLAKARRTLREQLSSPGDPEQVGVVPQSSG